MANVGQLGTFIERSGKLYLRYAAKDGSKPCVYVCPAKGKGKLSKAEIETRRLEIIKSAGLTGEMPEEMKQGITFRVAASSWLHHCMTRKRNPIKSATAKGYQASINRLLPMIGELPLVQITNKVVKKVVESLVAEELEAKTIHEIVGVIKYVVASVLDEEGERVYPRNWNHDFIDLPTIGKQHQPTFIPEQVTAIVGAAKGRYAVLDALLAGTAIRIGEGLAIEIGPQLDDATTISEDCKTIYIRKSVWNGKKQAPKTQAAIREVDLCDELAAMVKDYIGDRKSGFLFCSDTGKPLLQRNILRDSLYPILMGRKAYQTYRMVNGKKVKHILLPAVPGVTGKQMGFHAFRRFRATHLRVEGVPEDFIKFWLGHADSTITDRYSKMKDRVALRKEWAEKAGLGFDLPGNKVVKMLVPAKPEKGKVKIA